MSKHGIHVYPLKVEAITQFPPPCTITQLQSHQGKANFLRRFIANHAQITKGFMKLLKKDTPFVWDEQAQNSFKELKSTLTNTSLLSPPNYNKDFLLYLVSFNTTIVMVLVQTDEQHNKHVIYYLSKGIVGVEFRYAHVEKLALIAVIVVQGLWNYILLQSTTIMYNTNPM